VDRTDLNEFLSMPVIAPRCAGISHSKIQSQPLSRTVDFRGPITQPGSKGQYADVPLHAGLVCINGPDSMSAETK
jgi:hypothetical protein